VIGIYENTSSLVTNIKSCREKISKDDKVEMTGVQVMMMSLREQQSVLESHRFVQDYHCL